MANAIKKKEETIIESNKLLTAGQKKIDLLEAESTKLKKKIQF